MTNPPKLDQLRPFVLELTTAELAVLLSACNVSADETTERLKLLRSIPGEYTSLCGDIRENQKRLQRISDRLDAMLVARYDELKKTSMSDNYY